MSIPVPLRVVRLDDADRVRRGLGGMTTTGIVGATAVLVKLRLEHSASRKRGSNARALGIWERMSFGGARNEDRQVLREAQAIVMKVLNCNAIEASEVIRERAETAQRSVIGTARAIAAGGVANFH
jgi:hypothetical protein